MKSVGIKNLKDNLTEYLKLVRKGEVVYVTERDVIIAQIKKPDFDTEESDARFEKFLTEQAQLGSLRPAKRNKSILKKSSVKKRIKQRDWWNSYEQNRSERF